MNPAENDGKILRLAGEFLAGRLGVIEIARALSPFYSNEKRLDVERALIIFVGVASETDAFPIGAVRHLWSPLALEKLDEKIAAAESFYRDSIAAGCKALIMLIGNQVSSKESNA